MKTILAIALFGTQLFASSFDFAPVVQGEFRTSADYELIPRISVEVGHTSVLSKGGATMYLSVDGEDGEFEATVVEGDMFYSGGQNVYETVIKKDVLSDSLCGEYEAVEYVLTVTEAGEYDHYSYVTGASLRAEKVYSYDTCHSGYDIEKYGYKQI